MLGNRAMVQLCVLGFVLFFACYGQFESGLSAYGVEAAGISTSTLGTALAANTLVIVVAQFAVLRFVERAETVPRDRRRGSDLGRGVGRGRLRRPRARQPGDGDGRLHLDVRAVRSG